jgi:Alpha amylase, catalytic domain.
VANHTDYPNCTGYMNDQSRYHTPFDVSNWNDRNQVTHGKIGMWDNKTEDSGVQNYIHQFIEALKNCGVDGIRWDAAKHIGLPSEDDTFWQNVPDKDMYNYGEILDGTGGNDKVLFPEYQKYMSITDNGYGNGFASSFNSGQVNSSIGNFNQRGAATDKLVYWGESHDTYANDGGSSKNMSQNVIDRAYAVVAGNNGATALYFSRPSSTDKNSMKLGQKGSTHFTSKEVAEVNHMHNICAGEPNYYVHKDNVAAQVRQSGAIIVLGKGSNQDVSVANGAANGQWLAPGTYTDKVGGATFNVTTTSISGRVGSTGIAVIYNGTTTTGGGSEGGNTGSENTATYTPTITEGEISCFLETAQTGTIKVWAWNATYNYTGGTWPGQEMQLMGKAANGNNIYKWTYSGTLTDMPTGVIFSNGNSKITSGDGTFTNHGYYVEGATTASQTITATEGTGGNDSGSTGESTGNTFVYYNNPGSWANVYGYLYNSETENNGAWPGTAMTFDATLSHDGITGWWKMEVPTAFANAQLIVNDGGSNQYPAAMQPGLQLTGVSAWLNGTTLTNDSGTESNTGGSSTYTPSVTSSEISCFLETAQTGAIKAWIWDTANGDANYTGGTWPGQDMQLMGKAANGNNIYKWTYNGTLTAIPTGVIFSNNGTKITSGDGTFTNHGYYVEGATTASMVIMVSSNILGTTAITPATTTRQRSADIYTISGQLVKRGTEGDASLDDLPKGIYIVNGKKIVR